MFRNRPLYPVDIYCSGGPVGGHFEFDAICVTALVGRLGGLDSKNGPIDADKFLDIPNARLHLFTAACIRYYIAYTLSCIQIGLIHGRLI